MRSTKYIQSKQRGRAPPPPPELHAAERVWFSSVTRVAMKKGSPPVTWSAPPGQRVSCGWVGSAAGRGVTQTPLRILCMRNSLMKCTRRCPNDSNVLCIYRAPVSVDGSAIQTLVRIIIFDARSRMGYSERRPGGSAIWPMVIG